MTSKYPGPVVRTGTEKADKKERGSKERECETERIRRLFMSFGNVERPLPVARVHRTGKRMRRAEVAHGILNQNF